MVIKDLLLYVLGVGPYLNVSGANKGRMRRSDYILEPSL